MSGSKRRRPFSALLLLLIAPTPSPAFAWNALGHRVVADIAWQQLDAETRAEIVDTLRRNPRFDDDFAKRAPTEGDQDRWIFQQAAVWPDMIRGNREFDHPTWHYINHPIFVGEERRVTFNRHDLPAGDPAGFNVVQAISYSRMVLASDAPPSEKAVAYCWLFHLVGDIHQPLHAVALVCDKLPEGDRGGNSIPVVQGRNLHSLWDNLLGRSDKPNDVKRAVLDLEKHPDWFKVDTTGGEPVWVAESRELANSFVYCPEILAAVEQPGELAPISLPESYLKAAGDHARQRVTAAGLRLAVILTNVPKANTESPTGARTLRFPADRAVGAIFIRPKAAGGFGWGDVYYTDWQRAADALGEVRIPSDMQVRFTVAKSASKDLKFLADLPPDGIDMLTVEGTDATDEGLQYVGHLTGLRFLDLEQTRITDAGAKHLIALKQLQTLRFGAFDIHKEGFGVGDDAMGVAAFLPALECIDLRLTKVTDEGMSRLAYCKSLRSVSIPGTAVTDAGLWHLARLPKLEHLSLGVYDEGAAVTDEGMRTVAKMTHLKSLDLSGTQVGNEGLKYLAPLVNLESLSLDETPITNDGLSALAPFTRLKFVRAYDLGDGSINDIGARHLGKLPRLETIQANMELSNAGAVALAQAPRLEKVSLMGSRINDDCCAAIAAMPRLKDLWFQDCLITDAGLEELSRSATLESLLINDAPITSEGLRHLKKLPKLIRLSIDMDVQQDRSPDDRHVLQPIGELASLTDLDVDGFDGAVIKHLAGLRNLTRLEFGDKVVLDDAAMSTIGGFSKLTALTINASTASDAGLKALSGLKGLDYLQISCVATDDGLAAFHGMKELRMLQVASPRVTPAGLDRLAAHMPALQEINEYDYLLLGDEVTPSAKDAFWRRGKPEDRARLDAMEDNPPPPLDVVRWVNVADGEDAEDLTLASLHGKVVLVRFWGARINRTESEQPMVAALYEKYADQGFEIVGVHMTEHAEQFDAFIKHHKIAWPESTDREEHTAEAWNVNYSAFYLIDRAGTLRFADVYRHHLDAAVGALVAEPPKDPDAARQ